MTMKYRILLCSLFCLCAVTVLRAERVDMLKAGAKVDGKTLNTKLINSTIDRLNANGGGTLFFPAGTYLTGSIRMKSHITLELEAGATLLFSDSFDDYLPFVEVRHEGVMMKSFQPLIYAVDAENITIKGEGTLDGQGKKWWMEFCILTTSILVGLLLLLHLSKWRCRQLVSYTRDRAPLSLGVMM